MKQPTHPEAQKESYEAADVEERPQVQQERVHLEDSQDSS